MARVPRTVRIGPVTVPAVIAGLMALIAVTSIVSAVGDRNGLSGLVEHGVLVVGKVAQGQLWRLVSYALFETSPLSLLFSCLMLFWFGRDLAQAWGARRFLAAFFGLAAVGGAAVCLLGLVSPAIASMAFAGCWPVLNGLVIAWAFLHPRREVRLYGVVRIGGRWLVHAVIGGTVLYALFAGFAFFVPHFAVELAVLLWLGALRPWRQRRRRDRVARAARGEAWSFDRWYERERRRAGK